MTSSGMVSLYHTSGGLTLDRELVSTTGSGCLRPTFTAVTKPSGQRKKEAAAAAGGCFLFDLMEQYCLRVMLTLLLLHSLVHWP